MIPGEESPTHDLRSGIVELRQDDASYRERAPQWGEPAIMSEHRNDISAAAARFVGERDTFARTTTADQAYRG